MLPYRFHDTLASLCSKAPAAKLWMQCQIRGHICGAGKVHIVHANSGSAHNLEPAASSFEHPLSHLHSIRASSDAARLLCWPWHARTCLCLPQRLPLMPVCQGL